MAGTTASRAAERPAPAGSTDDCPSPPVEEAEHPGERGGVPVWGTGMCSSLTVCGPRAHTGARCANERNGRPSPSHLCCAQPPCWGLSSNCRLPGDAWHARSRRCRNALVAPLQDHSGALRSHAPEAARPPSGRRRQFDDRPQGATLTRRVFGGADRG
ncbi:hypothetical protein STAN_6852 [Streptomyces sp. CBMAI 2042]|nr:hypothetical protein STAN_6852 [Streptomyces sp. CBMAI 2042]